VSPYSSEQGRAGRTICAQQGGGIELPELAELLVLEGLDIAITGTEKLGAGNVGS
jgi:hypothetical protein